VKRVALCSFVYLEGHLENLSLANILIFSVEATDVTKALINKNFRELFK